MRRHPLQAASRQRLGIALCLAVGGVIFLAANLTLARDANQAEAPIITASRNAVAAKATTKSKELGFRHSRGPFSEFPPDGGVLIGLECGVGNFGDVDTVYAFRPIYQTPRGKTFFNDYGLFEDKNVGKRVEKTRVKKTVRILAKPGYAVGGLTLRSGLNINGLQLVFMRIDGDRLDPTQSYTSPWVGDRTGGGEAALTGNGAPVVGVFGSQDANHASSLGFYFVTQPPAEKVAQVDPPIVPLKKKPKVRPPEGDEPEVKVAADPPKRRPRVEPKVEEPDEPLEEEQPAAPKSHQGPPAAAADEAAVPILALGAVMITLVLGALACVGLRRRLVDRDAGPPPAPRRQAIEPPPLPTVLKVAPEAATGICELPTVVPARRDRDEPPALQPLEFVDAPDEDLPPKVTRCRAARGQVLPEVKALGEFEQHFPAPWIITVAHEQPVPFIAVGAVLTLTGFAVLLTLCWGGAVGMVVLGLVLAGLGLAAVSLPFWQTQFPGYLIYRQALVIVEGNLFTVVPWSALTELNHPRTLVAGPGEKFELSNITGDLGRLYDAVQSRLRDRLMTPALAALENGRPVRFGPVGVSTAGLYYGGQTLEWSQVARMVINIHIRQGIQSKRTLALWRHHGLSAWCEIDLNNVPNDWFLLDLVKRVCPPHLLVPAGR
jgi:hypothetical protein